MSTNDLEVLKAVTTGNRISAQRLKLLLNTTDKMGRRPLHIAAYKCDEELVQHLGQLGAKDTKDNAGNTAGKLAEKTNRRRSRELIESFADEK